MEQKIKEYIEVNNFKYIEITNDDSMKKIYDLYFNNKVSDIISSNLSIEMLYYGMYYKIQGDIENMKKYYLMAVEKGNYDAMYNLGTYYYEQEDFKNMKKYYIMANKNKKEDYDNIYRLGNCYYEQKDYENMKKYYLIAIERGNSDAMNKLENYYKNINDYENLINLYYKYLTTHNTGIDLIKTFDHILNKKDIKLLSPNIIKIITNINLENLPNVPNYMILLKNALMEKIDFMDLHFKYAPNNDGFNNAKNDFMERIAKKLI